MAKLCKNKNGVPYFEITCWELIKATKNGFPICDGCCKDLIGFRDLILIPVLNMAFCNECGQKTLKTIQRFGEDIQIEEKRVEYYKKQFGIEG